VWAQRPRVSGARAEATAAVGACAREELQQRLRGGGRGTRVVQARRDADQGTRAAQACADETEVQQLRADPHGEQRGRARQYLGKDGRGGTYDAARPRRARVRQ
jgi:hypothetical protein